MKSATQLAVVLAAVGAFASASFGATKTAPWTPKLGDTSTYKLVPLPAPPGFAGATVVQTITVLDATSAEFTLDISVGAQKVNSQTFKATAADLNASAAQIAGLVGACEDANNPIRKVAAGDYVSCKLEDGKPTETYIANVPFAIIYYDSKGVQGSMVEKLKLDIEKVSADTREGKTFTVRSAFSDLTGYFAIERAFLALSKYSEAHSEKLGLDFAAQAGDAPAAQTVTLELTNVTLGK